MAEPIRVGVVGTGWIAAAHMDALRRLPDVTVAAACGRDPARTQAFATRWNVPHAVTDTAALLDILGLAAVHDCTSNEAHDAVNLAVIQRGLHLYAEKPLSETATSAREIWQAAEHAGIVHGLNHQYRMYPAVQEMRARIRDGRTGPVYLLTGRYHQQSGLDIRSYKPRMLRAGTTLGDIGTHWIDTASFVLGSRVTRVFATMRTVFPERIGPDGTPVAVINDDVDCVLVQFDTGAQGAFTLSKISAGQMNDLTLAVDGQACSFAWAQQEPDVLRIGRRESPGELLRVSAPLVDASVADLVTLPGGHPLGYNDALLASVREFYRAVRGEIGRDAMRCATFADGYHGMAFVEAAVRSAQTGAWADCAP